MSETELAAIYIYPVKSFSGIRLSEADVTEKGLRYDRQWMVIDSNNQFLSQRRLPKMALVKTRISENSIILSASAMQEIAFPLNSIPGESIAVDIWKDRCLAELVSAEIDQWISDFLQINCRLVYQPVNSIRQVDQDYALPQDKVYFSDGFPFLIVSENSLLSVNGKMDLDLTMLRFRPNLVIKGCSGFAEDYWREISIGDINFRLPKPCSRCSVPCVDPETAQVDKEPLKTLNRFRKWKNKVYFGQNALHENTGKLSVGDQVTIIKTGPAQPPI